MNTSTQKTADNAHCSRHVSKKVTRLAATVTNIPSMIIQLQYQQCQLRVYRVHDQESTIVLSHDPQAVLLVSTQFALLMSSDFFT